MASFKDGESGNVINAADDFSKQDSADEGNEAEVTELSKEGFDYRVSTDKGVKMGWETPAKGVDSVRAEVEALQSVSGKALFQQMFARLENVDLNEGPLSEVMDFWGRFVDQQGLNDALFFKSEEMMRDFLERFAVYENYIGKQMDELKKQLSIFQYQKFGPGWEDKIKKAAYMAFFVHYGEKRRSEFDENGAERDYVYHVARATFNCLFRKMQFFDEETAVATLLHDTRENCDRGLFALLQAEDLDELKSGLDGSVKKTSLFERVSKRKEDLVNQLKFMELELNEPGWDLERIMDIVTKGPDQVARELHFLELLDKLTTEFDDENDEGSFNTGLKAMMVKMADRLDNIKTFMSGDVEEFDKRSQVIKDETAEVYAYWANYFEMNNTFDQFLDYLHFRKSEYRQEWNRIDDLVEASTQIRHRFREDFEARMQRKAPGMEHGKDYFIVFRPAGYRYVEMKMPELNEDQYEGYSRSFRSFMLFIPMGNQKDLKRLEQMADAAEEIFCDIFHCGLDNSVKGFKSEELDNKFGRVALSYRKGKHGGKGFDGEKYGAGVWTVFLNQYAVVRYLLGAPHLAYFYDDEKAEEKIREMFLSAKDDLRSLLNVLRFDEGLKGGGRLSSGVDEPLQFAFKKLYQGRNEDVYKRTDRILSVLKGIDGISDVSVTIAEIEKRVRQRLLGTLSREE